MTTLELLKAARARIERPEAWTQGAYARSATNGYAELDGPLAVCWCSVGALMAASPETTARDAAVAEMRMDISELLGFNDSPGRTHAEVLDLFDRTIARLEATS